MATQITESLAVANTLPNMANHDFSGSNQAEPVAEKFSDTAVAVSEKSQRSQNGEPPESPHDGIFQQKIIRDSSEVLVRWTKEEEARVVRKADWLFLPIFSV